MKTVITKIGDVVTVTVEGRLEYQDSLPLKENLEEILEQAKKDSVPKKIIFNLDKLEFVGSSGISTFVQTLKDVQTRSTIRPKFCRVRSEFKKVMTALDEEAIFEFYDDESSAKNSFNS